MNPTPARVRLIGLVLSAAVSLCLTGGIALLFDANGKRNVQLAHEAKTAPAGKTVAAAKPHATNDRAI